MFLDGFLRDILLDFRWPTSNKSMPPDNTILSTRHAACCRRMPFITASFEAALWDCQALPLRLAHLVCLCLFFFILLSLLSLPSPLSSLLYLSFSLTTLTCPVVARASTAHLLVVRTGTAFLLLCVEHVVVERVTLVHLVLDVMCPVACAGQGVVSSMGTR